MTGVAGDVFCVFCLFSMTFFERDTLELNDGFAHVLTFTKVLPQLFCRFLFGCFWPSCVFFLLLGGLGSPCRVFPAFSPWFSGGWGGGVLCFCLALLHLASSL